MFRTKVFRNERFNKNSYEINLERFTTVDEGDAADSEIFFSNRLLISRKMAKLDEALRDIRHSSKNLLIVHYSINESFDMIAQEKIKKLTEDLHEHQAIALQCESNGKFCVVWKKSKDEVYAIKLFERNNVEKDDLVSLSIFILEFLSQCLEKYHSGLSIPPEDNFNIELASLTDINGLNLLFHAASNGNTKITSILLQVAFNVNMMHERILAVDFAYSYRHFDTVLLLLKNDSMFPAGFSIENCPNEGLKAFAEVCKDLHAHIKANNLEEISKILTAHPNFRYFYNTQNQSASAAALSYKNFKAYELLLQNNLYLSIWEDLEDITDEFNLEENREIREIHFRNKKDIQEHHLNVLMSKCSVGHDDEKVQERLNHVMRAFQTINKIRFVKILLKIAALLPNLQIVFDFNRESVNYLDPTQTRGTLGLFYINGRIFIGAKQLLDSLTEHEVFATIVHEVCHFVMFKIFRNDAKPYKKKDKKTESEFETISNECKLKKNIDEIIGAVYDYYPEEMFHAELIVRVPHFYAYYCKQPEIIEKLKIEFKALFDFWEPDLESKLEKKMIKLKKNAEKKRANERKILILTLSLIVALITGAVILILLYEPTYRWNELDNEQKMKIFNQNVKFEGIISKFYELYGQNESSNGVFEKLRSEHIRLLFNNYIFDLNVESNVVLEKEMFLVYYNLTDKFKEKAKNATIEFQGQPVIISSLLGNNTERIFENLDSGQIKELIKNQSSIIFGKRVNIEDNCYVQRRFLDKSLSNKNQKPLSSVDVINSSSKLRNIILSDGPGTGKTTVFKNVALELKQKFPLKWVQFVDLKTKIEVMREYQFKLKNSNELETLADILDLKGLDNDIFRILYENNNVVIFWDSFDEISPDYSDVMLQLMQENKNVQFLATRPNFETIIAKSLNCTIYKLEPYSTENMIEFFEMFFEHKKLNGSQLVNAKKNAQIYLEKVEKEKPEYLESLSILKMIAKASLKEVNNNYDTTEFYKSYDNFKDRRFK